MENYCVLSINKIHTLGNLKMCHKHNFRELPLKHVDLSKIEDNEELIDDSGLDYVDLWYRRIKEEELKNNRPVSVRKNSVLAYEVLTTFSKDMIGVIDMEKWKEENIAWMKETFGEENILSMQLHEDESVPHIHTIVVPINKEGRLCARDFTGGRAKMFRLQTSYGEKMASVGLKRGEMYSKAHKTNINTFYKDVNKAANKECPKMEKDELIDNYIQRVNRYVQDEAIRSLKREKDLQRKLDLEKTKNEQLKIKYAEAIRLQNDLEEQFNYNRNLVKKRLNLYRQIEKAVPRTTLNTLLQNILVKFKIKENIRLLKNKKNSSETNISK